MVKHRDAVSRHATQRSQQRWGLGISIEEVERQIASKEAEIYERENPTIWKILIRIGSEQIPIVYNRRRRVIITVLPRDELTRLQQDVGAGLTKEDRKQFFLSLTRLQRLQYERWKDNQSLLDPEYNRSTVLRAQKRMALVDSLPKNVREVVHEYGHEVVYEFWCHGIRGADDMVILIEAARKSKSAASPSLPPLYRHFGAKSDKSIKHLITASRGEPAPTSPTQNRYGLNRKPNCKSNILNAVPEKGVG